MKKIKYRLENKTHWAILLKRITINDNRLKQQMMAKRHIQITFRIRAPIMIIRNLSFTGTIRRLLWAKIPWVRFLLCSVRKTQNWMPVIRCTNLEIARKKSKRLYTPTKTPEPVRANWRECSSITMETKDKRGYIRFLLEENWHKMVKIHREHLTDSIQRHRKQMQVTHRFTINRRINYRKLCRGFRSNRVRKMTQYTTGIVTWAGQISPEKQQSCK